jgi:hypothetical protein
MPRISGRHPWGLSDEQVQALRALVELDGRASLEAVSANLKMSIADARDLMQGLVETECVAASRAVDLPDFYILNPKGRVAIATGGLP